MDCLPHFHVAAYHADAGYNNDTPGAGVLCALSPDVRLAAGTYFNSIRKQSAYAGAAWQPWGVGPLRVGAYAGVVTGYRAGAMPFAAAVASIPAGRAELHLIGIPAVPDVTPATAELSVSFNF